MSSEEHSIQDAEDDWDRKYERGLPSLTKPDPFFVSVYENVIASRYPSQGRALDIGGGLGRHSLLLAEAGWNVSLVDISRKATQYVEALAQNRGLPITVHRMDAATFDLKPLYFDLIVLFYHFDRLLFPRFRELCVAKIRSQAARGVAKLPKGFGISCEGELEKWEKRWSRKWLADRVSNRRALFELKK